MRPLSVATRYQQTKRLSAPSQAASRECAMVRVNVYPHQPTYHNPASAGSRVNASAHARMAEYAETCSSSMWMATRLTAVAAATASAFQGPNVSSQRLTEPGTPRARGDLSTDDCEQQISDDCNVAVNPQLLDWRHRGPHQCSHRGDACESNNRPIILFAWRYLK